MSIGYLVVLIGSAGAAIWLWKLNDAYEMGALNRPVRIKANMAVLSLAIIGSFASVVLFFLSQRANSEAATKTEDARVIANSAQKQAGQALRDASAANERAGKASERAAGLELKAAELNLTTERMRKGGILTDAQTIQIIKDCLPHEGTSFDVASNTGDPEAENLMIALANILLNSKWKIENYRGGGISYPLSNGTLYGQVGVAEIEIIIKKNNISKLESAANALSKSLNAAGIKSKVTATDWSPVVQGGVDLDTNNIHVLVGKDII